MLHFTSRAEWERGREAGSYQPDAMAVDGFVHLSFGHQLAGVATAYAPGARDLVLLVVDPGGLESDLRIEDGFPHLYRPIPTSAVRLVSDFPPEADGSFVVPDNARLAELALSALPSFDAVLERSRSVMSRFPGPWWIGGGWAVDAGAGTLNRPHLDLDLVVLRPDVAAVRRFVTDHDVRLPGSETLRQWDGREFNETENQLWLRPDDGSRPERWQDFAADPGFFEILVEEFDPTHNLWKFRRNGSVNGPLELMGAPGGFLRVEVALLYKAMAAAGSDDAGRAKAQGDFDHAAGHLSSDARAWLKNAVALAHGDHPWLSLLSE